MAKLHKVRGLTVSIARARRGEPAERRAAAIVSAVADPETGEAVPVGLEMPTGTVKFLVGWIGDDPARAAAAADDSRKGVRDAAAAVLGG